MTVLDLSADIIDVRDIIERFEEMDSLKDNAGGTFNDEFTESDSEEWHKLSDILDELVGTGGDEQWRDGWYPATLVNEKYTGEYTKDLITDCYCLLNIPDFVVVDWEETWQNIKVDYSSIEIDGITYYYR